ncbi:12468_t:CDS:2 [Funneliformis mosseae]|uniref:12468_t:CDS:1 n=1 Tax=Funneliformis mosseae TaxID=27381 RepID=A0A9N9FV86_FUNMO|nr:12468_t:CDS:2 [Funneliformis mosseae]
MPTCQTEELTKQRYPNIRVPRSIDSYDECQTAPKNISKWATGQNKFLYETDWINETNEIDHNFDAKIDINDSSNNYLIDFLMDEIRLEDFDEEGESSTIVFQGTYLTDQKGKRKLTELNENYYYGN